MLEARHLCKTYRTKGGAVTRALDDVSVTFAEKGMVFILGKSGSGKSTLLNVCGGLDKADSGEIVIKGRSSAERGEFDFDSYRNTFVGFVFQEYNILEEFTVEENIALALELQHKKRDKEVINKILADVEMLEYANRKPNTLSGGQKQRVAIARALVKNPEIIMADEPTGALDSNTGKQVFDTLKKLSRDKLVLIVSHDREFAEQYGDRIIELKDGKIISDMTREENEAGEEKNVRFVGTDTVCVQSGAELTEEDFTSIKAFLSKAKGQAVITASRNKVDVITRELRGGEFNETAAQPKVREYSASEKKMIRSRLPVRHAIKMGGSSLKTKPVRLVFTILLSVIAFLLFGVASTLMLYDADKVTVNAFTEANYRYISLGKRYYYTNNEYRNGKLEYSYEGYNNTAFTLDDYNETLKTYPEAVAAIAFGGGYAGSVENLRVNSNASDFYSTQLGSVLLDGNSLNLLAGNRAENADEVTISEFLYNIMKSGSLNKVNITNNSMSMGDKIDIKQYSDVIGEKIVITLSYDKRKAYTITGVFENEKVPAAYAEAEKAAKEGNSYSGKIEYEWREERDSGLFSCVGVTQAEFESYAELFKNENNNDDGLSVGIYFPQYAHMEAMYGDKNITMWFSSVSKLNTSAKDVLNVYNRNGEKITSLPDGTIAVSSGNYGSYLASMLSEEVEKRRVNINYNIPDWQDSEEYRTFSEMIEEFEQGKLIEPEKQTDEPYKLIYTHNYGQIEIVDCDNPDHWAEQYCPDYNCQIWYEENATYVPEKREKSILYLLYNLHKYGEQEGLKALSTVRAFMEKYDFEDFDYTMTAKGENGMSSDVIISGLFFYENDIKNRFGSCYYASDSIYDTFASNNGNSGDVWTQEQVSKYKEPENAFVSTIFLPASGGESFIRNILSIVDKRGSDDTELFIGNALKDSVDFVNELVEDMSKIFLWIGVVLAVFSMLLMFNFISASISSKKKEIGILRAIGSRTLDVFKIFIAEALIIALICVVIATIGSFVACYFINDIMVSSSALFTTGLLVFGPISVLCIIAIALVTSLIATIIPVAIYSRKPPVASIRAL